MNLGIRKKVVRVVVAGDPGTGKSTLIAAAAAGKVVDVPFVNIPKVLPPTTLSHDKFQDRVPITIIDTSSRVEDAGKVAEELKNADAIVLTYACDRPETLDRLSTFWLPELRRLEVKLPVIVTGCKLDTRGEVEVNLEHLMSPIMQQFREIETCMECSAYRNIQIPEVFYYAQKAVLHPTAPLFDVETQTLRPRCIRALKRIFILCDRDRDNALSDAELNDFQVQCFSTPLHRREIVAIKKVVMDKLPGDDDIGVNERGLTLSGFLFLHALFIEKGRLETTWAVLRSFGYDDDIKLADELIPKFKRSADQSVELTSDAMEYLRGIYELFDNDGDNNLRPNELEDLFSTAPESPWDEAPYNDAVEKTALGGLSVNAFLSEWALMALRDPSRAVENLIYINFPSDPSSAVRVTRRRRFDRKRQHSDRNVYQCFVFGARGAGKSALLNSFIGRPFSDGNASTAEERYVANVVDLPGGSKKTLVLREIPEDGVMRLLSNKESLAPCDIAVFVYDSSDESSWRRATELLLDVASHGWDTGSEVPCIVVAAKDDLNLFPMAVQETTKVTHDLGIEAPIPISSKVGDTNHVFRKIVAAAEQPHLSIPETEARRTRKQYHRLVNRSLLFVSVGAAAVVTGLWVYRHYAARKSTSG